MTTDTKLKELVINKLTKTQYNGIATKDPNQLYIVTDAPGFEESRTNCITEIPQDIKLELNNGTLTLKAGSRIYFPNGSGVFDTYTVPTDTNFSYNGSQTSATSMLFLKATDKSIYVEHSTACTSGTTAPSGNGTWYDTTNNLVKRYVSGYQHNSSFPLCTITHGTDYSGGQVKSIDQIFNGFGYIGSTVFALPGVKGLIPDGRNEDGSLKNVERTLTTVTTRNMAGTAVCFLGINLLSGFDYVPLSQYNTSNTTTPSGVRRWYNPETNYLYKIESGVIANSNVLYVGNMSLDNNRITSFQPKTTFHGLDYNDKSTIVGWGMPSNKRVSLTLGASGSMYVAPANGWFCVSKVSTGSGQYINLINSTAEIRMSTNPANGVYGYVNVPAKTGDNVFVHYSLGGATEFFIFVYAQGEQ